MGDPITINVTINPDPTVLSEQLADLIQEVLDQANLDVSEVVVGARTFKYRASNLQLPIRYDTLNSKKKKEVREEYMRIQDYKCAHCGGLLDKDPPLYITSTNIDWREFPPGFLKNPVHLHHNHDTGMTEGAIHAHCNAYLWHFHRR